MMDMRIMVSVVKIERKCCIPRTERVVDESYYLQVPVPCPWLMPDSVLLAALRGAVEPNDGHSLRNPDWHDRSGPTPRRCQ